MAFSSRADTIRRVKKAQKVVATLLESKRVKPFDDMPDLEVVYDGTAQDYAREQAIWNQFNDYVWRKIGVDPMDATQEQMVHASAQIAALMKRWKSSSTGSSAGRAGD